MDCDCGTFTHPLQSPATSHWWGIVCANCPIFFSPDGSRIYSVGDKVTILNLHELSSSVQSDEIQNAWAKLLSGQHVDSLGGLVDLTDQELSSAWKVIESAIQSDATR